MKKANALQLLAATALFVAIPAVAAFAGTFQSGSVPIVGYAYFDLTTHTSWFQTKPTLNPLNAVTVYYNGSSAVVGSVASTDLGSTWGDQVTTTGTGTLDEFECAVINAQGGLIQSANITVNLYDAGTMTLLGTLTGELDFGPPGGGLAPGSAADVVGTGLSSLGINLSTTNLLVTQTLTPIVNASTALGVLLVGPPTVGAGSAAMYIDSSTFGPAGFYNLAGLPQADPFYDLGILQPTPTKAETWGGVKAQYRK